MSNELKYRRVSRSERTSEEETKKIRAERVERITSKIHALVWVSLAIGLLYVTDLPRKCLYDARVNRLSLNFAVIAFAANIVIMFYLTLWLPLVQKVTVPWDQYCPNMIPISTGLGVGSLVLFIVALWPIYGLLTPILILLLVMGLIFSTHFIPWPC